jgi:benzoyl-CoA reductase/2-hydroxyglutaryl-CoA dehydratase subunit BcrC/BadD/HgdB
MNQTNLYSLIKFNDSLETIFGEKVDLAILRDSIAEIRELREKVKGINDEREAHLASVMKERDELRRVQEFLNHFEKKESKWSDEKEAARREFAKDWKCGTAGIQAMIEKRWRKQKGESNV